MKVLTKISLCFVLALFFVSGVNEVHGQINYPRGSQRQTITQKVGDAEIKLVYHRPNVKGRKIWGTAEERALVPFGKRWRTGANENTTIEITQDSTIKGQKLPKGKYSFHAIPNADEWVLIFNKINNVWGTVEPKPENDALRINVKPEAGRFQESLCYLIEDVTGNSANVVLAWGKLRVPFKVDLGDVNARLLNTFRSQSATAPLRAANHVLSNKLTSNYAEAISWVDNVKAAAKKDQPGYRRITYNAGFVKSRLLAAIGKNQEAVVLAEKTIAFGRAENKKATDAGQRARFNPRGIVFLENLMKSWQGDK